MARKTCDSLASVTWQLQVYNELYNNCRTSPISCAAALLQTRDCHFLLKTDHQSLSRIQTEKTRSSPYKGMICKERSMGRENINWAVLSGGK